MPKELIFVASISILIFFVYVIKNVKHGHLNVKNAMIWIIMSVGVMFCVFKIDMLEQLASFLGIKTVSNMLFFIGFVYLLYICFNITKTVSKQNQKIINLTQEIALLRKEFKIDENRNKKNS